MRIKLFEEFAGGLILEGNEEDFKKNEKRVDALFKKLVPTMGPADTVEGEMIRAISRILYRYFNDGDYFFRGYGLETAKPSVDWLKNESPLAKELKPIFAAAKQQARDEFDPEKDGYLINMHKALVLICDYVESKKGNYEKNEVHDSRVVLGNP
jgi:hypothetical protein